MKVAIAIGMTPEGKHVMLHFGPCPEAALKVLDAAMVTGEYHRGELLWNAVAERERCYGGPPVAAEVKAQPESAKVAEDAVNATSETEVAPATRPRKPKATGGWAAEVSAAQAAESALMPG